MQKHISKFSGLAQFRCLKFEIKVSLEFFFNNRHSLAIFLITKFNVVVRQTKTLRETLILL